MIAFLKGLLVGKLQDSPRGDLFWMEVHGVGYEVLSSQRSLAASPPVGSELQLFTSLIVREDSMTLVGFVNKEERDLFNILQSASGVGVKVALALLSSLSVSEIAQAVLAGQYKTLTAAKGVGPKLAQKMVLDLKERMMSWRDLAVETTEESGSPALSTEAFIEAESVLLSLGYTADEVVRSLNAIAKAQGPEASAASSEAILRDALRWLAQAS